MNLEHRHNHTRILICAGIIAATLAAYEPIRHNRFVNYDDNKYITKNPEVTGGITRQSITWAFTKFHSSNWHPLTWLSHTLDCQLFGLNPSSHHIVSVVIHIVNALLLLWILTNITGAIWPSAFVAAVFVLHPLQVESVAWAAERKTVLSGLFWLLTMAAYIRYARQPRLGRYIVVLLVFGLCIMTKPIVVTLPLVLLLIDYWPLERIGGPFYANATKGRQRTADGGQRVKLSMGWLIAEKIPLLVMSAFLSVITYIAQKQGGTVQTLEKVSLDCRVANMFLSYIRYIGKMIWPSKLAVFYPPSHSNLLNTTTLICAFIFILISAISIYIGRRKKYIAVGWLWFVGTLVPMIGLVQAGEQAMANRYMYLSMPGLLIIIAMASKELIAARPRLKIIAIVMGVISLSCLLVLTRMQVRHWQNNTTLFDYALRVTENNTLVENNYGMALLEAGRNTEAIEHFNNAQRINKNYINAYINLGKAYYRLGEYGLAIQNWKKALELKPNSVEALNNMAYLLAAVENPSTQDVNKAIKLAQHACELTGYKEPVMLETLAVAYAAAGKFDDAVSTARHAIDAAKANRQEELTGDIQKRMESYKAGQQYIENNRGETR